MPNDDAQANGTALTDLFLDLPPAEQAEAQRALDEYCELLLQIFERRERERQGAFDESTSNSYDHVKVDSRKQ